MKTLVLQLARLGDIYQTWPVMRALRRAGGGELHLLARAKFAGAVDGLEAIDRLWTLDARAALAPLVGDALDIEASLAVLDDLVARLRAEGFERVINLSYSPFSSRLTAAVAGSGAGEVRGYTRHADGYLQLADDASAYFYAQVGPGRANRVHLTELFAQTAGVELVEADWAGPATRPEGGAVAAKLFSLLNGARAPIVVHLGASRPGKTFGSHKWLQVVSGLLERTDAPVALIGAAGERALADAVKSSAAGREAVDLVGSTTLRDVFALLAKARLAIGGDSAPVHIAALTGTPCLNLSFREVSFWETGPKSAGSRILAFEAADDLASDVVVREALAMLAGEEGDPRAIRVAGPIEPYAAGGPFAASAGWEWLQAIYMGRPFPVPESELCVQGLLRLQEANELALEQLAVLGRRGLADRTALAILDRFDEIIGAIAGMAPTIGILVRWFQTERIRLGPMPGEELLAKTVSLHAKLRDVLGLYVAGPAREETHDDVRMG